MCGQVDRDLGRWIGSAWVVRWVACLYSLLTHAVRTLVYRALRFLFMECKLQQQNKCSLLIKERPKKRAPLARLLLFLSHNATPKGN